MVRGRCGVVVICGFVEVAVVLVVLVVLAVLVALVVLVVVRGCGGCGGCGCCGCCCSCHFCLRLVFVVVAARHLCQVYYLVPPEYVRKRENDTIYACSFRKCVDMETGATDSLGGDCASDPQTESVLTAEERNGRFLLPVLLQHDAR